MIRPLESITGRELALALLDEQAAAGRPLSLDDALRYIGAAWVCRGCSSLWLTGSACRLCHRCPCGDRVDAAGSPCPVCRHQLD